MALTIDAWRRARKLSQSQLAELCGVSTMTIRNWEQHPDRVQVRNVPVICKALGVEREDVIFLPSEST